MLKKLEAQETEDNRLADFTTEDNPLLKTLKKPIRVIQFRIGSVVCRIPRSADDPMPDNIIKIGGFFHNLSDGKISRNLEEVT